ncbi:MAG: SCP2 sterol-binding domain-containing protein [Lachnospiraceae bacterium]|nr:SCP2 sterol-binding domain-containing protein [Lachnospiraceae bacterium]
MNINIYYGGRGLIEDPTLYVLDKMEEVFDELRVNVKRYNLYEMKNAITTLPQTLKEADGIILAASVEWKGIGGFMQQFLDACWLYGDKNKMNSLYMCPVVISTTYGENEAMEYLNTSWELLGGKPCDGVCAYVEDNVEFETNKAYKNIIEKKAENVYRTVSQRQQVLPSSSSAIKQNMIKTSIELTPQESEQLSRYVADDIYVKQQKEDIEELASMFKGILSQQGEDVELEFIKEFTVVFNPQEDFSASYAIIIKDKKKTLYLSVKGKELECRYENISNTDVLAKLTHEVLLSIVQGRQTFQRAFMSGEMSAKGSFGLIRKLDNLFDFSNR